MYQYTAASDWGKLASEFSKWLPLIAPYGERLIEMAAPSSGMTVLDLACGTGEPGLTLARRMPDVKVAGCDRAPGMVKRAEQVRAGQPLTNIRFYAASGEALPFADGTFACTICRFGVMLFDNPRVGFREIHRVTRSGGRIALSVWDIPERVLCPTLTLWELERYTTIEWPRTFALSEPGLLERRCGEAGFVDIEVTPFDPAFTFDDLDHFMERNLTGRFIEEPFSRMSPSDQEAFRNGLREAARAYALSDGRVRLPQQALMLSATRT